jgi:acyl carrier protein
VGAAELSGKIREIFSDTLNIEVPSDETDLIDAGYIDSLALVELLFAIEREFGVSVPLDALEIDNFRNVRSIGELVAAANGQPG